MYTAKGRGDERRPDPSACEVGQTGAPEVAEPEQHECSDVTRFLDERIEIPWEARRSERYRGDPPGCQPDDESREENVQNSCRLIVGKRTSKPDERRDAMCNPRNVGVRPHKCSLGLASTHLMIHNSAHFDTVVIATVVSKYCDHAPLYRQAAILEREAGSEIGRATRVGDASGQDATTDGRSTPPTAMRLRLNHGVSVPYFLTHSRGLAWVSGAKQ